MMHLQASLTCDCCGARTEWPIVVRRMFSTWGDGWVLQTDKISALPYGWVGVQFMPGGCADPDFYCSQKCHDEAHPKPLQTL